MVAELSAAASSVVPGLPQQASDAKARGLGWEPTAPTLVEPLADGYPEDR